MLRGVRPASRAPTALAGALFASVGTLLSSGGVRAFCAPQFYHALVYHTSRPLTLCVALGKGLAWVGIRLDVQQLPPPGHSKRRVAFVIGGFEYGWRAIACD
jgi:hypothetical protein